MGEVRLDIAGTLKKFYQLEKPSPYKDYWIYHVKTPAHLFTHFIMESSDHSACQLVSIREKAEVRCVEELLNFLRHHEAETLSTESIKVIEGFSCGNYPFDSMAVISSKCHDMYQTQEPELHARTFIAFPIARCEFSGHESPEVVRLMRKEFVSTLDWDRHISPKVLMRYHNTKTRSKSIGRKRGLTNQTTLFREVQNLIGAEGSFVEVENYQGQVCLITAENDHFNIVAGDSTTNQIRERTKIGEFLQNFLIDGLLDVM